MGAALVVVAVLGLIKLGGPAIGPPPSVRPAAVGPVDPTAIAYQRESVRAMTWNVRSEAGGLRGSSGFCPWRNWARAKAETIAGVAHARDLNVLYLQEICYPSTEVNRVGDNNLLGPGWTYATKEEWHPPGLSHTTRAAATA